MNNVDRIFNREIGRNFSLRSDIPYSYNAPFRYPEYNWLANFKRQALDGTKFVCSWEETREVETGSIFSLEFSPDGSFMVCCGAHSMALLDPISHQRISVKAAAHTSYINCATFINGNKFATGSDDNTIKIWDFRNLSTFTDEVTTISSWVKSVHHYQNYILASSFDRLIAYDLDRKQVVPLYGETHVLRMCVAPETQKLIFTMQTGSMMVVHKFDIDHMEEDLSGFQPSQYGRLQAASEVSHKNKAFRFTPLLEEGRTRNQVEIIGDFVLEPGKTHPDLVTSVTIHPEELCILSRSAVVDGGRDYTSVHDLTDPKPSQVQPVNTNWMRYIFYYITEDGKPGPDRYDVTFALTAASEQYLCDRLKPKYQELLAKYANKRNVLLYLFEGCYPNGILTEPKVFEVITPKHRLRFFAKEGTRNISKYIKESGFSADGRIICSPHGDSVRLLGFDEKASNLRDLDTSTNGVQSLQVLKTLETPDRRVVSSAKFSPRGNLVAAGTLGRRDNGQFLKGGSVVFFQP